MDVASVRHAGKERGTLRHGAAERVLLYATAIQTGLRSNELRSLTRVQLRLTGDKPFVLCDAGSTKNRQQARQFIQADLAGELRDHVATKAPTARMFATPVSSDVPTMLLADLADARREWIKAAGRDADDRIGREQSDFLAETNHEGHQLDFHGLRHTTGAWLAMAGVPIKAVQTIMWHSSITLTMDTLGHLFPGQEAAAVAQLPAMLV